MADLFHSFKIKSNAQAVYQTFAYPEHLINWWPQKCQGKPRLGEVYELYFGPQYDWRAQVTKALPNNQFELKMTSADPDWKPTSFGIDLTEKGIYTNVSFYHRNWPEDNDHFKHSNFCWALLLNGMKDYIEKGQIIPFEERA